MYRVGRCLVEQTPALFAWLLYEYLCILNLAAVYFIYIGRLQHTGECNIGYYMHSFIHGTVIWLSKLLIEHASLQKSWTLTWLLLLELEYSSEYNELLTNSQHQLCTLQLKLILRVHLPFSTLQHTYRNRNQAIKLSLQF